MMNKVERRFIEVEGRRVMVRRAGKGPPLVMLHGSPGNSEMLEHEIAAASMCFTCFAFDTPGFGNSDPLPGKTLTVLDLAQATKAAMDALGLPPCPVYGTHTGALIAAELGAALPNRITGVILEGLPIFTAAEIHDLFESYGDYFAPMTVDPLGGHLVQTWIRFRDQFTWFPWASRDVARLNAVDRPEPADIHLWMMMFCRSFKTYSAAYRAACYHGHAAYAAAEALTVPAIFMASAEDMLYPHLDRLPPLKTGQRIERLAHDPPAKYRAITDFARSLPAPTFDDFRQSTKPAGANPAVQFIDTTGGQVFVRCYGNPGSEALILLHDAPGSGLAMEPLARSLMDSFYVMVPDLPGCGESDAPGGLVLLAASAAVTAVADALALNHFSVAATGCGTVVAAMLAEQADPRLRAIFIDDLYTPDESAVARIAPDLPLTPEGSHWITAWLMVRDGQIYRPWFDGRIAAQRKTQGNFDAGWLQDQTFEIMKARTSYHLLPRGAWAFDPAPALAATKVPVLIARDTDIATLIKNGVSR
jgi:pimeloyl-ACP methyl ester carboxylesterase